MMLSSIRVAALIDDEYPCIPTKLMFVMDLAILALCLGGTVPLWLHHSLQSQQFVQGHIVNDIGYLTVRLITAVT